MSIYAMAQFSFIARPEFPDDMADPIRSRSSCARATRAQVDVDMLLDGVGVSCTPKGRSGQRGTPASAEERRLNVAPALRVPLVDSRQGNRQRSEPAATGSPLHMRSRGHRGDPQRGKYIYLEFTARVDEGEADTEEDGRVGRGSTRGNGGSAKLLR